MVQNTLTKRLRHGGIVLNSEITSPKTDGKDLTGEITSTYSNYLCFTVSIRINQLISQRKYTSHQQENYDLITSLQDEGMGYRRISHYLNERGIKTSRGKKWTNSLVFSVLKRFRQRQERLKDVVGKEYEPVWGKFEVKWMRN